MPYLIEISPTQAFTRVHFTGEIVGRHILTATDELVAHPDYDAASHQLWSLADVTALDLSPQEMDALITHDQGLVETGVMGRVKVAIVITTELRELALRLYQYRMRASGQDIRLFETEAAAEAWLQES